jgi:hypothetical protein
VGRPRRRIVSFATLVYIQIALIARIYAVRCLFVARGVHAESNPIYAKKKRQKKEASLVKTTWVLPTREHLSLRFKRTVFAWAS